MSDTYRLYVPAAGPDTLIRHGSAIVGERRGEGIHVHYQDNAASNIITFEDRIHHAAGRAKAKYPTIAQAWFPEDRLVDVGEVRYDPLLRHWVISDISDADALERWTPGPHHLGGSPDLRNRAAGLRYGELRSHEQVELSMRMQAGTAGAEDVLTIIARRA